MTVGTALVTGNDPHPQLVEEAVSEALDKAGLTHASMALLFLTPEFTRYAQSAVTTAARCAQCMQVAGGIASGVLTETGWAVDRPAAAVMVFSENFLKKQVGSARAPLFSYAGNTFPPEWRNSVPRFGGMFSQSFSGSSAQEGAAIWQQSRLNPHHQCSLNLPGNEMSVVVSTGLCLLGEAARIECSNGFDLERLGSQSATHSLLSAFPAELRDDPGRHLHQMTALLFDTAPTSKDLIRSHAYRTAALIASNADQTVTLTEHVKSGQYLIWAIRQPRSAEAEMRQTIDTLKVASPAYALMFSCIGRGPFFYDGEDHDLNILRKRYPGLPILGTYGTGQIAPLNPYGKIPNRELQNSVIISIAGQNT